MRHTILTVNSGSSSLKIGLFRADGSRQAWHHAVAGGDAASGYERALTALRRELGAAQIDAVGHRLVHGGDVADAARVIDEAEMARLRALVPLAPLHLPNNLLAVELCRARFDAPQIGCFDTAFHHALPDVARRLPIPASFGMRRYGFHGLNYAHVAARLPDVLGETARGRVVVAHLGSGASLCLLDNLQSIDTTMGYTPAGGVPMGTRSGDLDPGVMLELARRHDADTLADLVYHRMGLLALSNGESSDMATLLASDSAAARFAVDYFCREVSGAIGAFAAKAGGLDALVFSGGIGEHAPKIRARICTPLQCLSFSLDAAANAENRTLIHARGAKPVVRIAADEEAEIARHVAARLSGGDLDAGPKPSGLDNGSNTN